MVDKIGNARYSYSIAGIERLAGGRASKPRGCLKWSGPQLKHEAGKRANFLVTPKPL